ncbi:hypothetical protein FA13DRAFT_1724330 [Coprinellus micaceus]|uniref:Uncharacterized protein n=1 Tax=Coprinellus micaceus TaxID=71717 RepID=A0A4Y7U0Z9_COPMI|nr:hypothetical protein FA13DRAFT_1724330 [Coprinellus micaceus]
MPAACLSPSSSTSSSLFTIVDVVKLSLLAQTSLPRCTGALGRKIAGFLEGVTAKVLLGA